MKVSSLTPRELASRLKGAGLFLETGPFVVHLRTPIGTVAEGISLLYADYPLVEQADFADFHVSIDLPRNHRRWFSRQALFHFDETLPFAPLPLDQAFPIFEWGLNWCVSNHANHYLMIHAAVIEKGGYAAILPGLPGSGKSTLCAALVHRGWRLLSDELTLIRTSDGKVIPLPRPISLKNESIDIITRYVPDATLTPKVCDTVKGTVAHLKAPADSVARATEAARAAWVIFPAFRRGSETRMEAISRSGAFMRVADNAFNYSLLGAAGFECLGNMINSSQCFDFCYSVLDDAVEAFAALTLPELPT